MEQQSPELQQVSDNLQAIADVIHGQCLAIAEELGRPRKMNRERIIAAENVITHQIHMLRPCLARFDAAYHAAARQIDTGTGQRRIAPPDWLEFSAHVGHLRNSANGWNGIRDLIALQCPPKRRPLSRPEETSLGPALHASTAAADRVFDRLHSLLNPHPQTEAAKDFGCFPDIGLPHSEFMALALSAWRLLKARGGTEGARFIDVGCGCGLKVLAALEFFDQASGLEYDPAYAQAARDLFARSGAEQAEVIEGDALAFLSYDRFDIIYFYRPISVVERLWQLEEHIVATARPGTILIAPYSQFVPRAEGLGCQPLADRIYVTGMGKRQAASLRREAEYIGTNVAADRPPLRSIWDPILEASRRRGF